MRLWFDRLKVVLRTLRYREAWRMRPRQAIGMLRFLRHTRPIWHNGEAELNVYSPPVGGPAYARYLGGVQRMARNEWTPLVAHVSVTDRCAYRCPRCSNAGQHSPDPPLDSLLRIIEQLRGAGTCRVALTGGEPLLRDDLSEIVAACGPELSAVLFTSGYRLDTSRAMALKRAGLAAAYVSLDYFLPAEHDRSRGQSGAFDQALAAIRACREAGLCTAVQAVVMPSLLDNGRLEQFLAFCDGLNVQEAMLLEEMPMAAGQANPTDDEAVRRALVAAHLRSAHDATMPKVSSMSWLESPECLGCQAGFSFLYITAGGEVTPCDFVGLSFGNIHELGLPAIHDRMLALFHRPSSACLARRLPMRYGEPNGRPLPWDDVRKVLRDYDPGPPPRLLQYLADGRKCPASVAVRSA
jgi:MoaA/NifB/PqqE/SkfB family radical SAM enzyme